MSNAEWFSEATSLEEAKRVILPLYRLPLDHLVVALCSLEKMQIAIYKMQKEDMI
jgi:hypothetical protein